jgi:16S rRNA (cytidine1402-2'-O)-methyltransferase
MTPPPPKPGRLLLVPTPLDHGCEARVPLADVLPLGTLHAAAALTHWISENAKSTRAFLKRVDALAPLAAPLAQQHISELPRAVHKQGDHGPGGARADTTALLAPALRGHDVGLVSEAGMPAVADPGASVVRAAHEAGLRVVPLVGPVSPLLALAASGLNGQNFAFVGYLPQDASARAQRIGALEALALRSGQTQLFIETPYRNAALLAALAQTLQGNTRLAVASALTLPQAQVRCLRARQWKAQLAGLTAGLGQQPALFAIGV